MPLTIQKGNDDFDEDEENVEDPNPEFVRAFDGFETYAEAASFIQDWIRV